MKYLIVITGEAGCGKDAIKKKLEERFTDIKPILRLCTRPMREGEAQFKPYIFLSNTALRQMVLKDTEEFLQMELIEDREWYYATHKTISFNEPSAINTYIGCYSLESLNELYSSCEYEDKITIIPIKIEVDDKTRILRQLDREDSPDCSEICRRFLADKKDYSKAIGYPHFIVKNDGDIEEALEMVTTIIESEIEMFVVPHSLGCHCEDCKDYTDEMGH